MTGRKNNSKNNNKIRSETNEKNEEKGNNCLLKITSVSTGLSLLDDQPMRAFYQDSKISPS